MVLRMEGESQDLCNFTNDYPNYRNTIYTYAWSVTQIEITHNVENDQQTLALSSVELLR